MTLGNPVDGDCAAALFAQAHNPASASDTTIFMFRGSSVAPWSLILAMTHGGSDERPKWRDERWFLADETQSGS